MRLKSHILIGFVLTVFGIQVSFAIDFEDCRIAHKAVTVDAECATVSRLENPDQPQGRRLDLFVARLPATVPHPQSDAFTIIQGGPGGSSVDLGIQMKPVLDRIRQHRDVLLIDQRGTGRSSALHCDQHQSSIDFELDETIEFNKTCLAQLAKKADLRYYTSSLAVSDLEAVRAAVGYSQLSIYGVSYGTRVAQHYLRRFPDQTRLLILDGVVDVGLNLAGPEVALRSQDAFDRLAQRCKQTPACQNQFGNIDTKFKNVRQRLANENVDVQITHPISGKLAERSVGEQDLLAAVRLMPYASETLALLPLLIANANAGDYRLLATQSLLIESEFATSLALGMHNSVVCSEDEAFIHYETAGSARDTYFGDLPQASLRAVCQLWPRGIVDLNFKTPIDSTKPVLILSGEVDPITPPANGERAHKTLQNSKHIVVPGHGHGVFGRGCVPFVIDEFLQTAQLDKLSTHCVERERAVPFFISANGPTP